MMDVLCVLPARIASRRIPEKPLQLLAGRTLVEWSWRAAVCVPVFDEVWVATDAPEIAEIVRGFGGVAVETSAEHASGTDRVAEVATREAARRFDIVVNFQADEPFADPASVERAVEAVWAGSAAVATVAAPVRSEAEWRDESVVKVVVRDDGRALYFSRAAIPFGARGAVPAVRAAAAGYLRHVGVYAFRREALERWVALPPSKLESIEGLEQLRALENGWEIHVVVGPATERGVDVPDDLRRVEPLLRMSAGASESHV